MAASIQSGRARPEAFASRPGHAFYIALAWILAVLVFAGFARTFYLNGLFARMDLTTLRVVHGVLFSAWIVLLVTQTGLVAAHRVDVHRRLGGAGAVLAVAMIAVGLAITISAGRHGFQTPGLPPPLVFMIVPLFDIVLFAMLVGAALAFRNRPDWHKRLMLLATLAITPPAFARLPIEAVRTTLPLSAFVLTALAIVAVAAWDAVARRHLHPVYLWGGLIVILSFPLRLALAGNAGWQAFARWLVA